MTEPEPEPARRAALPVLPDPDPTFAKETPDPAVRPRADLSYPFALALAYEDSFEDSCKA